MKLLFQVSCKTELSLTSSLRFSQFTMQALIFDWTNCKASSLAAAPAILSTWLAKTMSLPSLKPGSFLSCSPYTSAWQANVLYHLTCAAHLQLPSFALPFWHFEFWSFKPLCLCTRCNLCLTPLHLLPANLSFKALLFLKVMHLHYGKDPDAGKDLGQEVNGATEDEMLGWHHWLNGHEFEQTLGGTQGSLVCCSPQGCKQSDAA